MSLPPVPTPARPKTVTTAAGLLLAAVVVLLAQVPAYVYDLARFGAVVERAAAVTGASAADVHAEKSASDTTDGFALFVLALCVILLIYCARGILRPNHVARVLTAVTCGALLLCCGGVFALNAFMPAGSDLDRQVADAQNAMYPAWTMIVQYLGLLLYPLLTAALVLLLVPSANRYYRPRYVAYLVPVE